MPYEGYSDYFVEKVIISVATTGGFHGKEANPNLPEQPEEIVEDIAACKEAGASIVHVHARDEDGNPTKSIDRFQEIRERLQERVPEMLVNITTGGSQAGAERLAPAVDIDPTPELATIDVGPISLGQTDIAMNPREQNEEYARKMATTGVKPELEVFNQGHFTEVENLIEKDLLNAPYWCTLILGMQASTPPTPRNLLNLVDNLPEGAQWQCLAIGKHQLPLTTMAISLGGHVRVGMEDNVYYRKGDLAESNAQLVRRTARIAEELEREVATPEETREILGI